MYSQTSKRLITITSKVIDRSVVTSNNNLKLKIRCTLSAINYEQRASYHLSRNKHRTKNLNNDSGTNCTFYKCAFDSTQFGTRAIRKFSSFNEEAYRRFRSFANGEQFTKRFTDSALQYTVSVAYSPKDRLQSNAASDDGKYDEGELVQNFKLLSAKNVFESPTGEDNYILAYTDIGIVVGVLDGVGGWSEQGFDSSAISREIGNKITSIYLENPNLPPLEILQQAYDMVKSEGIVKVGSTTICFGIIDGKSGKLESINLGDSWFGVFRQDENEMFKCIKQSTEQTYYFNAPYQLSIIPQKILDQAAKKGSKYLMNLPEESEKYFFELKSGDIVIYATDGMIDNVFPEDIELFLNDNAREGTNLSEKLGEINKLLVQKTTALSLNTNFKSAFSQKLTALSGQDYIGGKPDDITSVMVYVK